ncbi:hypothetical protein K450DRAFT_246342 [Umbelopsis ramanniana AG]|uniref:EamA domain-containing protein n=1 Tax=Umbelopsis ramanniana AG TaxID=1314678 RepID=A0AAD5E7I8_UMBRA|nr:uncharacterized protein K450DRAFT_246342 [Umbelopsis ramanniana AG]KAI8578558.1 hypothetical protein K450DRAFT_246342 [Umbelopsis ramanniana AG]
MSFIPQALASGAFAALASVFAKLFTDSRTAYFTQILIDLLPVTQQDALKSYILLLVRLLCFLLIFACNSLMWTIFTKALNRAPSSTSVSVVNSAANFGVSALSGYAVFGEPLAYSWWLGAALIITGTLLLTRSQTNASMNKSKVE